MARNSHWTQILKAIATPLSFFVLTLLIIESTLSIVLIYAGFTEAYKWTGFLWMVGIFIGVVGFVAGMTIWNPKHLLYGKEEHSNPQLEESALRDQIEDLIVAKVKSGCLKEPTDNLS
jgi:hypothetical protein